MILRKIAIATKLNLAVAIPLILAFISSAGAYLAIHQVSHDATLAVASARMQQEASEISALVERIGRLMNEPGSQQEVAARIDPVVAQLRAMIANEAGPVRQLDAAMADRLTGEIASLDQFVLATMLARGNITESRTLMPSMLAGFSQACIRLTAMLRALASEPATAAAEHFSARAGELIEALVQFSTERTPAAFEATREKVTRFADEIDAALNILKTTGIQTRSLGRQMESARGQLYGVVMQLGGSSDRLETQQTRVAEILDHVQTAARLLRSLNESQFKGLLDRISERAELMTFGAIVTLLVGLGMAIGVPLFIRRSIAQPLFRLEGTMRRMAAGDTSMDVPETHHAGAIGHMARSVVVFRNSMREAERLRAEKADSEQRTAEQRRADTHKIAGEFHNAVGAMIDTVSAASTELEAAAASLTKIAERTQMLSVSASSSYEQATTNVQLVAATTDNLGASIAEIARRAHESSLIAAEAVQQAKTTDDRIGKLSQSADRIGDVVKLISSIAGQTNLLALNATIEAARAGDAGRSFAVVAQEVKALAANTAQATEEIGRQVSGIQIATHESVQAIRQINDTIDRIAGIASIILDAVEEQQRATETIARNLQQATLGTSAVAHSITDVSRGASDTDSASSAVLASAQRLAGESAQLKRAVEIFLTRVRAA